MLALVAVIALGLMAYVPGRLLSRLLDESGSPPACGRLLLELLVGNAAVGLIGLLAAEIGVFSLASVLGALAVLSVGAAWAGTGRTRAPYSSSVDLAGVALLALTLAWVAPPFETTLFGYDSSVYAGSGLSLARHGSIPFVDPTVAEMPPETRREFFPNYAKEQASGPFVRVAGGLLMSSLDDPVVLPAFHHLLSVWVALAYEIAGDAALGAPATYFAALAVWAIATFAFGLGGDVAGVVTTLLLLLSGAEYWYSRFLMPEVPSQYFLWGALAVAASSLGSSARLGLAAGLALGVAGLMRLDGLAHIIAALALWKALGGASPAGRGFLPAFALVALFAGVHQLLFPTQYGTAILHLFRAGAWRLQFSWGEHLGLAALSSAAILSAASATAVRRPLLPALTRVASLLLFVAYLAATLGSTRPDASSPIEWLAIYVGWPTLAAAAIGVVLWATHAAVPTYRFALVLGIVVFVQLLYDPRVTPAPLWAIRRFVPIVIPVICLAAALAIAAAAKRRTWLGAAAAALLVAGTWGHGALAYRGMAFQDSMTHVRALAANIPEGAVVVLDPRFALDTQLHIALWAAKDLPAYLLSANMQPQIEALRQALPERPIYWLGVPNPAEQAALGEVATPLANYRFGLATRRVDWYDARDDLGMRDVNVSIYRLHPAKARASLH